MGIFSAISEFLFGKDTEGRKRKASANSDTEDEEEDVNRPKRIKSRKSNNNLGKIQERLESIENRSRTWQDDIKDLKQLLQQSDPDGSNSNSEQGDVLQKIKEMLSDLSTNEQNKVSDINSKDSETLSKNENAGNGASSTPTEELLNQIKNLGKLLANPDLAQLLKDDPCKLKQQQKLSEPTKGAGAKSNVDTDALDWDLPVAKTDGVQASSDCLSVPTGTSNAATSSSNASASAPTDSKPEATTENKPTGEKDAAPPHDGKSSNQIPASSKASENAPSTITATDATAPPNPTPPRPEHSTPIEDAALFSDIPGFETQKDYLRKQVLFPLANHTHFKECGLEVPKGLVFSGNQFGMPLLAKGLALELSKVWGKEVTYFERKASQVFTKYGSEGPGFFRELITAAIKYKPSLVFIERLDTLYHYCDILGPCDYQTKQLVLELDRIETGEVFIICTVPERKRLCQSFLQKKRLARVLDFPIEVEEGTRKSVFHSCTKKWSVPPTEEIWTALSPKLDSFDVHQIEQLCSLVFQVALSSLMERTGAACCANCKKNPESLKVEKSALKKLNPSLEDWLTALETVKKEAEENKAAAAKDKTQTQINSYDAEQKIDAALNFSSVGGLKEQIEVLEESIIFPLKNVDKLKDWGIEPVKGLIFHGPPGTGKTLLGKALAAELSNLDLNGNKKESFSFFYKKGTDCFNMYVGETERNLRNLFAAAEKKSPSIIFFDELDGICGSRAESSGNSKFWAGVVTTMLGLMDGIKRGKVFVIAATNRLESLDPAIRRPGRFDKLVAFQAPKEKCRMEILQIHTQKWKEVGGKMLGEVAKQTEGYTGADIEQLCRHAFSVAVRRHMRKEVSLTDGTAPKDCSSFAEIQNNFSVTLPDFQVALKTVRGSNGNVFGNSVFSLPTLPDGVELLLKKNLEGAISKLQPLLEAESQATSGKGSGLNSFLIYTKGQDQMKVLNTFFLPSLLSRPNFKNAIIFQLDLGDENMSREKVRHAFFQALNPGEGKMGVLLVPGIDRLAVGFGKYQNFIEFLMDRIESLRGENVLLLASAGKPFVELPDEIQRIFTGIPESIRCYEMTKPQEAEYLEFFSKILNKESLSETLNRLADMLANGGDVFDALNLRGEICRSKRGLPEKDETGGGDEGMLQILNKILDEFRLRSRRVALCATRDFYV